MMIAHKKFTIIMALFFITSVAADTQLDDQLFKALYSKDQSAAKALIKKGANVNAVGNFGWTPLMVAASKDLFEASLLLIKHGADVNAKNAGNVTPLMWSVNEREISPDAIMILNLLINNGADVNAKTKTGRTALIWAKEFNHKEIVRILIEAGAKE